MVGVREGCRGIPDGGTASLPPLLTSGDGCQTLKRAGWWESREDGGLGGGRKGEREWTEMVPGESRLRRHKCKWLKASPVFPAEEFLTKLLK